MKISDALSCGNFKEVEIRSYKQEDGQDFFFDLTTVEKTNLISNIYDLKYAFNDNIITYEEDRKNPNKLIIWIRTLPTDFVKVTNEYGY